ETPLSIVAEWKRKACDFSEESTDSLVSVFSKCFEAGSAVLKKSDPCHIQRALASPDSEREICLRFEETNDPTIRFLMFGLIESLHLVLSHLTDKRSDVFMRAVLTIEEWKK
ncbi:hypothetical protein PMAYCL1PPCAC_08312, partial [Pristionchus mayeri]